MNLNKERELFETWAEGTDAFYFCHEMYMDEYADHETEKMWRAWQARAKLSQWQPISGAPREGRIAIFSPCYKDGDPMQFRFIDAKFAKLTSDATHWMMPEPPTKEDEL